MKKCVILLTIFAAFSVTGCKSNEEKANELIRAELSKTLYDYESYQPIETTIKEAKNTLFNNKDAWKYASLFQLAFEEAKEYLEKAKDAQDYMDIYGPPSYYSSARSDRKYYEYKKEKEEYLEKTKNAYNLSSAMIDTLKVLNTKLDTTQIIGWEVSHRFRCKTKGGHSDIGNYRYIIDKEFENIILRMDLDDEDYQSIIGALGIAVEK